MQICIWPSGCHCHSLYLASVKSRLVLPFWYRLTRVVTSLEIMHKCDSANEFLSHALCSCLCEMTRHLSRLMTDVDIRCMQYRLAGVGTQLLPYHIRWNVGPNRSHTTCMRCTRIARSDCDVGGLSVSDASLFVYWLVRSLHGVRLCGNRLKFYYCRGNVFFAVA